MKKIISILFVVLLFFIFDFGGLYYTAFAEEVEEYSDVLDDLKKADNFSEDYYPYVSNDYSLQVIQLAESVNGELYVYVYQPSGQVKNLCGSSINISTMIDDSISYHNYYLRLLNSNGVFFKYCVEDFKVLSDPFRHYAISSIFRKFDESIDAQSEHGDKITEVPYKVAKQYTFGKINGKDYCEVVDIETITVTDKFCGFVRYKDGFSLYLGACDSHFVAFNTDREIDKLLEADLFFVSQKYTKDWILFSAPDILFGEKISHEVSLFSSDHVKHTGGGLFPPTYEWDRIETVEDFIAENAEFKNVYSGALFDVSVATPITDEGKESLKNKKWVLRYAETSYLYASGDGFYSEHMTLIDDVTILRLKFETDGVVYNLGVIDDKRTESDEPINTNEVKVEITNLAKLILGILGLILILVILGPILPFIAQAIVWIIMLPFKLIAWIFKSIKKSVDKKE